MPPFRFEPFQGNSEPIIHAILAGGEAEARGAQASGQIWGQMAENLGNIAGGTLNSILKYKAAEPQRRLTQLELDKATADANDEKAAREAMQTGHGDPDAAIRLLETRGAYTAATKLRSGVESARVRALDEGIKTLDLQNKTLGQASSLLQGIPDSKDPNGAYAQVLPQVRKLVGEKLGAQLPDTYDPQAVSRAIQWGMSAREALDYRRRAGEDARDALTNAVTRVDLIDRLTKSTATYARTVNTPEEWKQMRDNVVHLGPKDVTNEVLSRFDADFSPAAVEKATKLIDKTGYEAKSVIATVNGKRQLVEAGYDKETNNYYLAGDTKTPLKDVVPFVKGPEGQLTQADRAKLIEAVKDNPTIWHQLTETARTQIAGDLHGAGFKFPAVDRGQSVAAAERWRMGALKALDEEYALKRSTRGQFGMTEQQYKEKQDNIKKSFLLQIGKDSADAPAEKDAEAKTATGPMENQIVTIKGKPMRITKVHENGRFDAVPAE